MPKAEKFTLVASDFFKKRYRKLIKGNILLEKRIDKTLHQLSIDPYYAGLKTHKVADVRSSWVTGDVRILWEFEESEVRVIDLLDIGGHGIVYRK